MASRHKCVGRANWQIRVRLFGYVEKQTGAAIANFNPAVHVIPHSRIEQTLKDGKLTTYLSADPALARSYFLQWIGVAEDGQMYLLDESPRWDEGEWVGTDGAPDEGAVVPRTVMTAAPVLPPERGGRCRRPRRAGRAKDQRQDRKSVV